MKHKHKSKFSGYLNFKKLAAKNCPDEWRLHTLSLDLGQEYYGKIHSSWCHNNNVLTAEQNSKRLTLIIFIGLRPGVLSYDFPYSDDEFVSPIPSEEYPKTKAANNAGFLKRLRNDRFERLQAFSRHNTRSNTIVADFAIVDFSQEKQPKPYEFLFPEVWRKHISELINDVSRQAATSEFPGGRIWFKWFVAIYSDIWQCIFKIDRKASMNEQDFLLSLKELACCAESLLRKREITGGRKRLTTLKEKYFPKPSDALQFFLLQIYQSIIESPLSPLKIKNCFTCNGLFIEDGKNHDKYCSKKCYHRKRLEIDYRKNRRKRGARKAEMARYYRLLKVTRITPLQNEIAREIYKAGKLSPEECSKKDLKNLDGRDIKNAILEDMKFLEGKNLIKKNATGKYASITPPRKRSARLLK